MMIKKINLFDRKNRVKFHHIHVCVTYICEKSIFAVIQDHFGNNL